MKRRQPRFKNPFSAESQVAELVRAALETNGWVVHPESCGWDLLAVATDRVKKMWDRQPTVGDTLGVETKLDAGTATGIASLMGQALVDIRSQAQRRAGWASSRRQGVSFDYLAPEAGPNWRAIAAPRIAGPWSKLGIAAWEVSVFGVGSDETRRQPWRRMTVGEAAKRCHLFEALRFSPDRPAAPPELVIDVPAGVPSPQTSSKWKIAAVGMCLRLRAGENITSRDFEAAGVNIQRFREKGWIVDRGFRSGRFILWSYPEGNNVFREKPPDQQWPDIAARLNARER